MVFPKTSVAAAKVIADFAKGNDKLVIKGVCRRLESRRRKALAAIPSKEVLPMQIAGLLKSPVQRARLPCWLPWLLKGGGEVAPAERRCRLTGHVFHPIH